MFTLVETGWGVYENLQHYHCNFYVNLTLFQNKCSKKIKESTEQSLTQ